MVDRTDNEVADLLRARVGIGGTRNATRENAGRSGHAAPFGHRELELAHVERGLLVVHARHGHPENCRRAAPWNALVARVHV